MCLHTTEPSLSKGVVVAFTSLMVVVSEGVEVSSIFVNVVSSVKGSADVEEVVTFKVSDAGVVVSKDGKSVTGRSRAKDSTFSRNSEKGLLNF